MKLTQGVCVEEVCMDRGTGPWAGCDERGIERALGHMETLRAEWRRHRALGGPQREDVAPDRPARDWNPGLFTGRRRLWTDDDTGLEAPSTRPSAGLRIERQDIDWRPIGGCLAEISFRVHNDGATASVPTVAEVSSAPFGAHLDWTPLQRVEVPAIPPGESRLVTLEAEFAAPVVRVTRAARRPALAADAPERGRTGDTEGHPLVRLARALWLRLRDRLRGGTPSPSATPPAAAPAPAEPEARQAPWTPSVGNHVRLVPSSPVGLDSTPGPPRYWLGNIEVRLLEAHAQGGAIRAERHQAHERLARPGIVNHALLEVGCSNAWRKAEFYKLEARILDEDGRPLPREEFARWSWRLHACDGSRSRNYGDGARMLCSNGEPFELRFTPPPGAGRCRFELHVTREFTGDVAVVEFDIGMVR